MITKEDEIVSIIKKEIKRQGLSENSLSKQISCTQSTINKYLSGKTSISTKNLLTITKALGIRWNLSINNKL